MITKYYISFNNSDWSEFFPSNTPLVKRKREGQEIFKRAKVDMFHIAKTKNVTVYNQLALRFFDDTYFGTDIYYKINIDGVDKFKFIQPINAGKLNSQNGYFECTPDTDDEYREIMLKYEERWNCGTGSLFVTTSDYSYPRKDTGAFVNVDFDTLVDAGVFNVAYTNASNGIETGRNAIPAIGIGNLQLIIIVKNLSVAGPDPKLQITDSVGASISNQETITANGIYTFTCNSVELTPFVELSQVDNVYGSSGSFDYEIHYGTAVNTAGNLLKAAILNTLSEAARMNLSFSAIYSTYLWNDVLPTGHATNTPNISTYITANPTKDYVTEEAAIWNYIFITKADEITTEKLTKFDYSLKDILDIVKTKLRAFWYIDEDGNFRIEHEKYFLDYIAQADLTAVSFNGDKPEVDAKEYTYMSENLYSQLNYGENNMYNVDWITYPSINYSPSLTSNGVRSVPVNVTTDIDGTLDDADNAINTGFMLLKLTSAMFVDIGESVISAGTYNPNMWLSWSYLFIHYWDYNSEALTGTVNNASHTFLHVKEFLKQPKVKFRLSSDFDWKKPFTASRGTAWHDTVTYDPESGFYTADLCYNPYAL